MTTGRVRLKWHGAAHYHIFYQDMRIVVDPLYTRLSGDVPHLEAKKEDLEKIDYLLLTHGHLDHSCDFPYLLFKHAPVAYAPKEYLQALKRGVKRDKRDYDFSRCYSLEDVEGTPLQIGDIEITPYRIGTEEIDLWFIRSMFVRPLIHKKPAGVPGGGFGRGQASQGGAISGHVHRGCAGMKDGDFAQRRADALGLLAEAALGNGLGKMERGEPYQVMIHVDSEIIAGGS